MKKRRSSSCRAAPRWGNESGCEGPETLPNMKFIALMHVRGLFDHAEENDGKKLRAQQGSGGRQSTKPPNIKSIVHGGGGIPLRPCYEMS